MSARVEFWCGHGVLVATFTGEVGTPHVARLRELCAPEPLRLVVVADLRDADTTNTEALLELVRTLSALRRRGANVVVANAAPVVAVSLRPLPIHVVDTTEQAYRA